MSVFIKSDGDYFLEGGNVRTVIYSTDALGNRSVAGEYMTTRHDFLVWHAKSCRVVEEMQRENAEAVIANLPKGRVGKR